MDWIEKGWGKPRLKVTGDLKYRSAPSNFKGLESKTLAVESFVAKPSVPRNISVTEVSVGKILVQWDASYSGTPFEYKVYAQSTGQTFLKKSTIQVSNKFRATINSLTPGVTYRIYVFAINEAGSSELAPPSSITLSTNSVSSSQTGYVPPSAAQIAEDQAAARAKATSTVSASTLVYTPISYTPASVAPASQAPASQAPASQAPASQAPASQAPASQAPASQAPASQAPASQAPASQAPASQAPASQAPASQAPASQAPASQAPASAPAPGCPAYSGTPRVPDAPTNVRAVANSTNDGFIISWNAPNSYGLPITQYTITQYNGYHFNDELFTPNVNDSFTCTNPAPRSLNTKDYSANFVPSAATYYIFGVRATNSVGNSSVGHNNPASIANWAYYNSVPDPPGISVSSSGNTSTVTWSHGPNTGIIDTTKGRGELGDNMSKDPTTVITGFVVKCYDASSNLIDTKTITGESTKTTTFTNLSGSYTYTVQARNSMGLSRVASAGNYVGTQAAAITNINIQTIYGCIPRLSFTIAAQPNYTQIFCNIYYRALSDSNVSTTPISPPFVQDSSGNYYKSDYNNDRGGYTLPVTAGSNVHILPVNTSLHVNTKYLVNIDLLGTQNSTQVIISKASSFYTSVQCDAVDKPVILSNSQVFSANWSNVTTTLYVTNSANNIKNNLDFFMRESINDNEDIRSYNNINPGNFFPRSNSYILQLRPGSSNTLSLGARGSSQVESDPYTIIAMKYPPPTNLQYVNSNFGATNIYLSWTSPQPSAELFFVVTDVTNSYSYSATSNTYLYLSLELGVSYTFNVTVGNSVLGSNSSNLSFTTYMPDSASNCYHEIYNDRWYLSLIDYIRWDTTASNIAYGVKYNLKHVIGNTLGAIIESSSNRTIYTRYYPLPYSYNIPGNVIVIPFMGGKEALNKSVTTTSKDYVHNALQAYFKSCCGGYKPHNNYSSTSDDRNAINNSLITNGGMSIYDNWKHTNWTF